MAEKEMESATVVALVPDLMFASRVRGVAPEAVIARSADALVEAVDAGTRLVLVDLQAEGALDALRALAGGAKPGGARVVAWGPHVMEEALESAREAGAEVMARGAFVKQLPQLVAASAES
ncbi:MAG: hypothetical protein R6U63_11095 [Longimicrobiales bacterium]